jgi:hypothetical protein
MGVQNRLARILSVVVVVFLWGIDTQGLPVVKEVNSNSIERQRKELDLFQRDDLFTEWDVGAVADTSGRVWPTLVAELVNEGDLTFASVEVVVFGLNQKGVAIFKVEHRPVGVDFDITKVGRVEMVDPYRDPVVNLGPWKRRYFEVPIQRPPRDWSGKVDVLVKRVSIVGEGRSKTLGPELMASERNEAIQGRVSQRLSDVERRRQSLRSSHHEVGLLDVELDELRDERGIVRSTVFGYFQNTSDVAFTEIDVAVFVLDKEGAALRQYDYRLTSLPAGNSKSKVSRPGLKVGEFRPFRLHLPDSQVHSVEVYVSRLLVPD